MDITLSAPISSTSFDKVWIESLIISGKPDTKVQATITMKPYNGVFTLDKPKVLIIKDVFDLAGKDSQFATVVGSLMQEVERQAKLNSII
jgi:hypothetical protein